MYSYRCKAFILCKKSATRYKSDTEISFFSVCNEIKIPKFSADFKIAIICLDVLHVENKYI